MAKQADLTPFKGTKIKSLAALNTVAWYHRYLPNFEQHAALTGPAPTAIMWAVAQTFTKNTPGCEALFTAMQLRPTGCTVPQHAAAGQCGPARNHRKLIIEQGMVTPVVAGGAYFLKLTAKGVAHVKARGVTGDLRALLAPTVKAPKADKATAAPKAKRVSRKANKVRVVSDDTTGPAVPANVERDAPAPVTPAEPPAS